MFHFHEHSLETKLCDGLHITLFQRDLLLAYEDLDKPICLVAMKYFLKHASNWLCKKNCMIDRCRQACFDLLDLFSATT